MVKAPMETVQTILRRAFLASGYRMRLSSPYGGCAEKQVLKAGESDKVPPAPFSVDFEVLLLDKITVVRLHRKKAAKTPGEGEPPTDGKQFANLIEVLSMWFNQHGCLQGILGL